MAYKVKAKILGNMVLVKELGHVRTMDGITQSTVICEVIRVGTQLKEPIKEGDLIQKRVDVIKNIKYDGIAWPPTVGDEPSPFFLTEGQVLAIFDKSEVKQIKEAMKEAQAAMLIQMEAEQKAKTVKKVEEDDSVETITESNFLKTPMGEA